MATERRGQAAGEGVASWQRQNETARGKMPRRRQNAEEKCQRGKKGNGTRGLRSKRDKVPPGNRGRECVQKEKKEKEEKEEKTVIDGGLLQF